MAIIDQSHPTHFNSQNKWIHIWYHQLTYISNEWVIRVSKLANNIDLDLIDKEYNLAKVLIDFENCEIPDNQTVNSLVDKKPLSVIISSTRQVNNIIDKLYPSYIESKSTWMIK